MALVVQLVLVFQLKKMKKVVFKLFKYICIITVFFSISCKKENNNWEVEFSSTSFEYDYYEFNNELDYSKKNPIILKFGSNNSVWGETHFLPKNFFRKNKLIKEIIIEIQDSTGILNFNYENNQIFDSLKCVVYHRLLQNKDGYYRIRKGFVSGVKVNGEWTIDYEVYYGGANNDKFRMVKDAKY